MANHNQPKAQQPNQGQSKLHEVRNPTTGETRQVTQEEWRNRRGDSSLDGFERVDGAEDDESGAGGTSGTSQA